MQKRHEESMNPFSIASGTSHPKEGNPDQGKNSNADLEETKGSLDNEGKQSGGHEEQGEKTNKMVDASTSPVNLRQKASIENWVQNASMVSHQSSGQKNSLLNDSMSTPNKASSVSFYEQSIHLSRTLKSL